MSHVRMPTHRVCLHNLSTVLRTRAWFVVWRFDDLQNIRRAKYMGPLLKKFTGLDSRVRRQSVFWVFFSLLIGSDFFLCFFMVADSKRKLPLDRRGHWPPNLTVDLIFS